MKVNTIVVGYDGSPDAKVALEEAIGHTHEDGTVHVVTVHHPRAETFGSEELPEEFRYAVDPETPDRARLCEAERRLETAGIRYRTHLPWGRPADAILDVADSVDADLIVLGSRGLGTFERFLRGSVSSRVTGHAHTNTLIVHRESTAAA